MPLDRPECTKSAQCAIGQILSYVGDVAADDKSLQVRRIQVAAEFDHRAKPVVLGAVQHDGLPIQSQSIRHLPGLIDPNLSCAHPKAPIANRRESR